MQEIEVDNELGLKVFINGIPDARLILEDKDSGFLEALELEISEWFQKKKKKKTLKIRKNKKPR